MADDLPPLAPDLLEELQRQVDALPKDRDASRKLEWLIDALILRGQLPQSFKRLSDKIRADREGPRVRLTILPDKYQLESPDVPCAELVHLCGVRCCGLEVALSDQDVHEQKVPFQIERPYLLPRDPATKRCTCLGESGACTIYDVRPGTCRVYDCRDDRRVWLDYENRIPAPMPEQLIPAHAVSRDDGDPAT